MHRDSDDGIIHDNACCTPCFEKLNDFDKIKFGHIKFGDGLTTMV